MGFLRVALQTLSFFGVLLCAVAPLREDSYYFVIPFEFSEFFWQKNHYLKALMCRKSQAKT